MSESPGGRWTAALTRCSTALVLAVCATACAGWMQAARAQTGTTFQDDLGLDGLLDSILQGNDTVVLDEADLEEAVPSDQPEEAATPEASAAQGRPEASPAPATPPAVAEPPPALPMPRPAAPSTHSASQARPPLDPQCPLRLERLGALFQSSPDFVEESGCQNQGAVAVEGFGGGVSLPGRVVVACPVAEATALWLRKVVQTEALETFGTPVVGLSNVNGYSCRMRSGGYISEHGFANAIDIGTFHFEDGRRVNIEGGWRSDGTAMGDLTADWFARINEGACDYFQLVLNPNSDSAHQNHFHFDLGPWKSCD